MGELFSRARSRGQAFPLVVFSMITLMALSSLAIDVGSWRYQQRREQTAADSAALAGTVELAYTANLASIRSAAQTDAATNGFSTSNPNVTVTVNQPPLSGSYAGNTQAVEVIVSAKQYSAFASLFGINSPVVTSRAVAMLSSVSRNCIYALDTNSAAITENGINLYMPQCGIISNGGLLFNQGTINAASIGYAGSSITVNNTVFNGASPKPAVAAADPCPLVAGCAYIKANPPTSLPCYTGNTTFNSNSTMTLNPGRYCNQVIFEGNGAIVLNPGVYDFQNGFTINSGPPSFTGTGVTIYNQGTMIFDGTTTVNLSAPSTGNYAGILIFQPSSNGNQFIVNSGPTNDNMAGMIYVPGGTIMIDGALSTWLMVVGHDIVFNSGSSVNDASSSFPGYGHAVLVE